jgi:hypothetical protein
MEQIMNLKFPNVCKGCVERHPNCHSSCQKYIEAKAAYEAKKAELMEAEKRASDIESLHIASIKKARKSRKRQER